MVEQGTHNPLVVGSNPTGPTRKDLRVTLDDGALDTRTQRSHERAMRSRRLLLIAAGLVVAGALLVAGGVFAYKGFSASKAGTARTASVGSASTSSAVQPSTVASAGMAEVPSLVGMGLDQANTVLQAAGFIAHVSEEGTAVAAAQRRVSKQQPDAGTVAPTSTTVEIVVPPLLAAPTSKSGKASGKSGAGRGYVVVIDPGHQSHADSTVEPIGPGSKVMKPKVTGGATGVATGIAEYELNLQLANNLKDKLEADGVKVVLTRTTNDVNVSNSERAAIANAAKANLFIRIHADGSTDPSVAGISTLHPSANPWTKPIVAQSKKAALLVQKSVVTATGATDRGAVQRSDLAGFNWSKVPSVLVETGFLSNAVEDRLLTSSHYQDQVASGIAAGVMAYLTGGR
jgi:N-acetylmuramoyl-L-alanine amidase